MNILKHLLTKSFILSVGAIFSRLSVLFLFILASSNLSTAEFGKFAWYYGTSAFILYLIGFSFNILLTKTASDENVSSDLYLTHTSVVKSCTLLLLFYIVNFLLFNLVLIFFENAFFNREVSILFAFTLISLFKQFMVAKAIGYKNFKIVSFANVVEAIVLFILVLIFNTDLISFLCVMVSSILISTLILFINQKSDLKVCSNKKSLTVKEIKLITKYLFSPYLAGLIGLGAIWLGNTLFYASQVNSFEYAVFSFAQRIYSPAVFIFAILSTVSFPFFNEYLKSERGRIVVQTFLKIIAPIIFITILSAALFFQFGEELLIFFGTSYSSSYTVITVLLLAAGVQGACKILTMYLFSTGKTGSNLLAELLFAVIFLLSLFLFNFEITALVMAISILIAYCSSFIYYLSALLIYESRRSL